MLEFIHTRIVTAIAMIALCCCAQCEIEDALSDAHSYRHERTSDYEDFRAQWFGYEDANLTGFSMH